MTEHPNGMRHTHILIEQDGRRAPRHWLGCRCRRHYSRAGFHLSGALRERPRDSDRVRHIFREGEGARQMRAMRAKMQGR